MTKYNITLDVWHQIPETVVTAMQGEINSRFLEITITDKGNFFNLTGKTVMVYMTKPDGKIIFNSCSVVDAPNGKINVSLTSQMSIVAGVVKDFEVHIIGNDKSRLKVSGICLKIKDTSNVDEAIESTNEFTALVEALKKADESLEYVTEFLAEKEQEIDQIVSQKMQDVTSDFNESMTSFTQQVNAAVTSANQATQAAQQATAKVEADGAQAIQEINQNFNTAMTGFTQEIDAAVKKAEDAAGTAEEIAEQAAIDTINTQKNQANGIAGLDGSGKLIQMPTAADVGAVPTSRTINGKALTSNITITAEDIGTSAIFLASHPVGSLFETTVSTNPGTLYGGTWAAWGGGRTPVGVNTADTSFNTVEKTGGEKTHTLTIEEMPAHTHDIKMRRHTDYSKVFLSDYYGDPAGGTGFQMDIQMGMYVPYTGGGQAHNNLQPYITCYIWKRTT